VVGVEPTRTTSLVRVAAVVVLVVEVRVLAQIQVGVVVAPPGELAAVMVAPVVVNCPARCRRSPQSHVQRRRWTPTAVEVVHSCRHRRTAE
jgi:hypothetical protein